MPTAPKKNIDKTQADATLHEFRKIKTQLDVLKGKIGELKKEEKLGNEILSSLEDTLVSYMKEQNIRSVMMNDETDLKIVNKRKLPSANVDRFSDELHQHLTQEMKMKNDDADTLIDTVQERMQESRRRECEYVSKLQCHKRRGVKRKGL